MYDDVSMFASGGLVAENVREYQPGLILVKKSPAAICQAI
jgi:hypothetical protein